MTGIIFVAFGVYLSFKELWVFLKDNFFIHFFLLSNKTHKRHVFNQDVSCSAH